MSDKEHGLRCTACLSQAQCLSENPATGLLQLWPKQSVPLLAGMGQMCSAGPDRGRAAASSRVFPGPGQLHTTLGLPRAPKFLGEERDQQALREGVETERTDEAGSWRCEPAVAGQCWDRWAGR